MRTDGEPRVIDVLFLVLPETLLLDLAGPAEAFRLANQAQAARGCPPAFALRYICAQPEVCTSVGLHLSGLEPLPEGLPPGAWVVLLGRPGLKESLATLQRNGWLGARHWLTTVVAPALARPGVPGQPPHRLITICVGTLLAADAGLLGRRQVTTHHEHLEVLARLAPQAQVCANRVFVVDGPVWSSAGITAGIDLALHCVAEVCGDAVAAAVAETMVVFQRRGADDPQRTARTRLGRAGAGGGGARDAAPPGAPVQESRRRVAARLRRTYPQRTGRTGARARAVDRPGDRGRRVRHRQAVQARSRSPARGRLVVRSGKKVTY